MIETLRIANLAVVERVTIEFGPGLNVVTGETGAGKSLVLGGLALLAGARAGADAVREGADEAVVEAVFRTDRLPDLEAELGRRDLAPEDHGLVVVRSVARSGRSRAEVAGRLVPIATLAELFAGRLEISSQHESQSLRRVESHGRLLDEFGELTGCRRALERAYEELRGVRRERARLEAESEERGRRADYLAFQLQEIDAAGPVPGELTALELEHRRLAHAERLRAEAASAAAALAGDPAVSDAPSADDLSASAERRLTEVAALDPELGAIAGRVRAARAELAEAAADLARYVEAVEAEPERLARVEARLHELERLRRKHGGRAEGDLLRVREEIAVELAGIEGGDERLRELTGREEGLRAALGARAEELSAGRARAARRLSEAVRAELAELAMPRARLEVALEPAPGSDGMPCGPAGAETPQLLFSANPGEPPRPLQRVASGGEISRLLLALKSALRRGEAGMVLVFDEVDAGIGGRVADRVGRALADLARDHQVLCITHLPQIAAFADVHVRVEKREVGGRTRAEVTPLEGEARVEEIARMAAGAAVSEATREHARSLLRGRASGRAKARGSPALGPS